MILLRLVALPVGIYGAMQQQTVLWVFALFVFIRAGTVQQQQMAASPLAQIFEVFRQGANGVDLNGGAGSEEFHKTVKDVNAHRNEKDVTPL